jgi:hypothetical protein
MTPLRMVAVTTVTAAFALYAIGTLKGLRGRRATLAVCRLLAAAVAFDLIATALMQLATPNASVLTVHGLLGYSALAGMAAATLLVWRHRRRAADAPLGRGLLGFLQVAWIYWVIAYFTGAALVAMRHRAG